MPEMWMQTKQQPRTGCYDYSRNVKKYPSILAGFLTKNHDKILRQCYDKAKFCHQFFPQKSAETFAEIR